MYLSRAERLAEGIRELLAPACERISVAGSVRRRKSQVKDLELVAMPRPAEESQRPGTLFAAATVCPLEERIRKLTGDGECALDMDEVLRRNGDRYKRLTWDGEIGVDLFIVRPPAQWGVILALRTGPHQFNKLAFTRTVDGGLLPGNVRIHEGQVEYWIRDRGWKAQNTPEEGHVFKALGLPAIVPEFRSASHLWQWVVRRHEREVNRQDATDAKGAEA